jgi:hypothetical protein
VLKDYAFQRGCPHCTPWRWEHRKPTRRERWQRRAFHAYQLAAIPFWLVALPGIGVWLLVRYLREGP